MIRLDGGVGAVQILWVRLEGNRDGDELGATSDYWAIQAEHARLEGQQ